MQTGKLDPRPVITDDLPLDCFDEGFKKITTGSRDALKVILRP
jgi:threonine dehydrogenase-like Zn-dependent dehydrogenase